MIGLLSIPWTMTAELFPIEIRGVSHSICFGVGHMLMFASVQCYYGLISVVGGVVQLLWFFSVISITASIYVYIFLPETHGRKLSEITEYFNKHTIYLGYNKRSKTRNKEVTNTEQSEKLMN